MKKTTLGKALIYALVCLTLLCALLLSSCKGSIDTENADMKTKQVIDLMISNNPEAVYEVFEKYVDESAFYNSYLQVFPYFDGIESYDMSHIGWKMYTANNTTTYSVTYKINCTYKLDRTDLEDPRGIVFLETIFLAESGDMVSFKVVSDDATVQVSGAINIPFLVFSLLCFAFTVWMLIDCMRRSMSNTKKICYILLMITGISLTFILGNGYSNINFALSILYPESALKYTAGATLVKISIPVFAICYFFSRKKYPLIKKKKVNDNPEA